MSDDTRTSTIIQALHILSNEIKSEDWVANGVMVQAADRLEELEAANDELVYAAKAVVERWYSPAWKEQEHTAVFINRLRDAIAKEEGEVTR